MIRMSIIALFVLGMIHSGLAQAEQSLIISSLTEGSNGSFTGSLSGVGVIGNLSSTTTSSPDGIPFYAIQPIGAGYAMSVANHSSLQYSCSNIYSITSNSADQVGYGMYYNATGTATYTISFSQAVSNIIFEVANLDSSVFNFSRTAGLSGLTLLSGNGGLDGDGLAVLGKTVADANPGTLVAQDPTAAPLTTGPRSAYGSILLSGSYTSLTIDVSRNPFLTDGMGGDGGSFTLAASAIVPEPSSLILMISLVPLSLALLWKRNRLCERDDD